MGLHSVSVREWGDAQGFHLLNNVYIPFGGIGCNMEKRAEVVIHGRVQKAGFRDLIDEAAFNLNLNGHVKNDRDGTVRVTCEGREESIREFLEEINIQQYPIRVEKIDVEYLEPTHEFKTFEIIREEDMTAATFERMDMAARYMREMNTNLSQKIDGLGERLENKMDENTVKITGEIHALRDDFRSLFDQRLSRVENDLAEIKAKIAALN